MSVDIARFNKAMNLDGDEEDALIKGYLEAAENSIKNAIGEDKSGKFYAREDVASLLDVAAIAIAGSYYQYRLSLSDAQAYPINLTSNSIIGQLRGMYDVFKEEEVENG